MATDALREGASGWQPLCQPAMLAHDGQFLLDHFLRQCFNPFYRIDSEQALYDDTIDGVTGEPLSLADFNALERGTEAPDALQRDLGSFIAESLVADCELDFFCATGNPPSGSMDLACSQLRWIKALNPFRPLLSPELELHLLQQAAARYGREVLSAIFDPAVTVSLPDELPIRRPKSEHEARFRQRIENLRALRNIRLRNRDNRDYSVLIVGAGPAGLMRAVSATLHGLPTTVLELRPENAPRRPQIVVIRSKAVIALLDRLGVIDFLFKENRIFSLGRLRLEVSLADTELALTTILSFVTADDHHQIVKYGTCVERIEQDQKFARVTARKSDERIYFSPQLLVIADGGHSPTSELLSITRREQVRSHTGIIAIFRADASGLPRLRRMLGELLSKLNYTFHRHVSRRGAGLEAGTILQVPGHHYLGLDLMPDEEMRLRDAIVHANGMQPDAADTSADGSQARPGTRRLQRLVRFWARYAFEAIRTHPKGSAPHTGGRPISWLPLDPQLAMPIEIVTDRADVLCGHIGETFVMLEGDAQCTIHPGSAYGCAKAFLSARLFDFLLPALSSRPNERCRRLADRLFLYSSELMVRDCEKITRFFKVRG